MTDLSRPLSGKKVLITRAAEQAGALQAAIAGLGGYSDCLPLFTIEPVDAMPERAPSDHDGVIFTSRNAVENCSFTGSLSSLCLAVGPATAAALESRGVKRVIVPDMTTSEGLLDLPALFSLAGQHWLIVKGEGGRDKLPEELALRGAQVDICNVYKRQPIDYSPDLIVQKLQDIHAVIIYSGEGLQHLVGLCPGSELDALFRLQLVVPGSRVVKMALDLGFKSRPWPVKRMTNADFIAALQAVLNRQEPGIHEAG